MSETSNTKQSSTCVTKTPTGAGYCRFAHTANVDLQATLNTVQFVTLSQFLSERILATKSFGSVFHGSQN